LKDWNSDQSLLLDDAHKKSYKRDNSIMWS